MTQAVHKIKFDSSYAQSPWEKFGVLRQDGPVTMIKMPLLGKSWAATSYESVGEVLKNTALFVRDPVNAGQKSHFPMQWVLPRNWLSLVHNMMTADGEKHRRLRGVVDKAFAMRNIESMHGQIEKIVTDQMRIFESELKVAGKADLITHFSRPVPLTVICELLGLPLEDRPKFTKWFSPFSTINSMWGIFKIGGAIKKVSKYLRQQFVEVRDSPRDGLISALVHVEHEGQKLNDEELLATVFLLLAAGHETTVHLINNTLLTLLQHPEAMSELQSDWSKIDAVLEEVLRYASPIQMGKPRHIVKDVEFFGKQLKRGSRIVPVLACANFDPDRFENPNCFDINRERNYHMTFGSGPHVCLGIKLARSEASAAIKGVLTRWPKLRAEFDLKNPKWNKRFGMRSMQSFMVSAGE